MPPTLPVLPAGRPEAPDPVRSFGRSERAWLGHLGDVEQLDVGLAACVPALAGVPEANQVFDAAPPPGSTAAAVVADAHAHFAARGGRCLQWSLDPSAPPDRTAPLADHLRSIGFAPRPSDLMTLVGGAECEHECFVPTRPGLLVLPTRSAFRHARTLADEAAAGDPRRAEVQMLHIDDPHCDGLIALDGASAAGWVTVLAAGDVGRVEQLFVAERFRRRGVGRALLRRAIEVCARSCFRQVVIAVPRGNEPAAALFGGCGFRRAGEVVRYVETKR